MKVIDFVPPQLRCYDSANWGRVQFNGMNCSKGIDIKGFQTPWFPVKPGQLWYNLNESDYYMVICNRVNSSNDLSLVSCTTRKTYWDNFTTELVISVLNTNNCWKLVAENLADYMAK
jgi:hypothetical protein